MSPSKIAKEVGVCRGTVYNALGSSEIREKIDRVRNEIAEKAYQKAASNVINAINTYEDDVEEKKRNDKIEVMKKQHGFTASMDVLRSIGVLPSNAMAPQITNILNVQNNTIVSPVVERLLNQSLNSISADQVIDCEVDTDE